MKLKSTAWLTFVEDAPPDITLRVDRSLWSIVVGYLFDYKHGERAGILLVRTDAINDGKVIVAEKFIPITEEYIVQGKDGLNYDGRFSLHVARLAEKTNCGAILVHAHTFGDPPMPSSTDTYYGEAFLAFMRRRLPDYVHGLLVLGNTMVTGICTTPSGLRGIQRVMVAGIPSFELSHNLQTGHTSFDELDRQLLAIGPAGQSMLSRATVAVIGLSGGGSHVSQQLIHAGVGKLIPVDHDVVDARNLRRLVSAIASDVDQTLKVNIPVRMAATVRPSTQVVPLTEEFPSPNTIEKLREVDIIIGCVDNWATRDAINTFALQYRIPYIDIGAAISPGAKGQGLRINGQIVIITPDGPCLRCMGLVTDKRVAQGREQRQYTDKVHEPQVVSVNGTLASEAVTSSLMLLSGDSRLARRRRYHYPPGLITEVDTERDPNCPSCLAARLIQ